MFAIGLANVLTILIFTILLTRTLSISDFGLWILIVSLLSYTLLVTPIVNYWTIREIPRGIKSGKTALLSSPIFTIFSFGIYISLALLFEQNSLTGTNTIFFAAILIPTQTLKEILSTISMTHKPEVSSIGLFISELTKIILLIIHIVFFTLNLESIIFSVFLATIIEIFVLAIFNRTQLRGSFQLSYLKKWFKFFWLPTFPRIGYILNKSDVIIFAFITMSLEGVAIWGIVSTIAKFVSHAFNINKPLYPKLLAGGKKSQLVKNLTLTLYLAFPLAALTIIFAEPGVYLLNPNYDISLLPIAILCFAIFFRVISDIFSQGLVAIETVDVNSNPKFLDMLKSKLFYVPALKTFNRASYIIFLILLLIIFTPIVETFDLVIIWASVMFITQLPFTVYFYYLAKKEFDFNVDWKIISKYLCSAILVFGMTYFLIINYLTYDKQLIQFSINLLPFVFFSVVSYLGLTFAIDSTVRTLCKNIFKEISNKL